MTRPRIFSLMRSGCPQRITCLQTRIFSEQGRWPRGLWSSLSKIKISNLSSWTLEVKDLRGRNGSSVLTTSRPSFLSSVSVTLIKFWPRIASQTGDEQIIFLHILMRESQSLQGPRMILVVHLFHFHQDEGKWNAFWRDSKLHFFPGNTIHCIFQQSWSVPS